ncbi:MAG: TonB-dependent receptor [Pseudomonadales bacterium]
MSVVTFAASTASAEEAKEGRRIEEIVVTAEKREATVSDTSISITAFGEEMIEDFGLQSPDELVNFIPATTRDAYDIRIRGVGRNFRALGGDPGVATYYNGVYSEDFGIAATENGLYDVARIEVLRGPQGTLYGRNSIGGALNYITNKPTYEFEGEIRALGGNMDTREFYGILSGPLIKDTLAARVVALSRERDDAIPGYNGGPDVDSIDDQNVSVALNWKIAENWESNLRWNDRSSDRDIGMSTVIRNGPGANPSGWVTDAYAFGMRPLIAGESPTDAGVYTFTHPVTGASVYGKYVRPGVDPSVYHRANSAYGVTGLRVAGDADNLDPEVAANEAPNETFDHNAVQFDVTWDINETTSLKYLGGWMDFDYTFDIDLDYTNGPLSQWRQTVLEAVETYSHELQLLWQIGDNLQLTSGLYYFNSDRLQNYAFRDLANQGRYTRAANYGFYDPFVVGPHTRMGSAPVGAIVIGRWEGDPTGSPYEYRNYVETDAYAAYTQGTYTFSEQWALTVGVRWAKDEKSALEKRTGYFELAPEAFTGTNPDCSVWYGQPAGTVPCTAVGITPLALANITMGNAVPDYFNADPNSPILSTCPGGVADPNCTTPLRLQGIPYSFADSAAGKDQWDDVTWRVNLDWTPNDDTLVYASVTTGYRAGGYSLGIGDSREATASGRVPLTYDKEEVMAYELGYKGTLLDGQMQVNASAYLYDYDNYQDRIPLANLATGGSTDVVKNAKAAENMGLEVEVTWLPVDGLTLGGNASWTKTEYKDNFYVLEDDNPLYPTTLFPDRLPGGADEFLVRNLEGNELKRIPEWKATAWAYYDWVFDAGVLTAGTTYAYTGEYYSSGIERDLDKVPDAQRVDVSLTWRDSRDRWNVRAFVDNVFDEIATRGIDTSTASGNWLVTAPTLYPRFYGLDVTYRFGAL